MREKQEPEPNRTLRRWIGLVVVTGVSCLMGWYVYRKLIVPAGPLGWDESGHALWGLLLAHDVQQGDWLGLFYDWYRQVFWPPLHSSFLAAVFSIAGPSALTARVLSVLMFVALGPLLYLCGRRLGGPRPEIAGLVAAGLALTAPLMAVWASRCMLEMMAVLALSATLLAYFRPIDEGGAPPRYWLVGVGLLAVWLAKTNYAAVLALAILAAQVTDGGFTPKRLVSARNFYMVLPLVVGLGIWFAYPAKLAATWDTFVNVPWGPEDQFGSQGLLFYPSAFVNQSGSPWLFALFAISLIAALRRWRDERVRVLITVVLIQLLLGQLHHTKVQRHILPIFPALYLLAGRFAAGFLNGGGLDGNRLRLWAPRVAIGLVLAHSLTLFARVAPFDHRRFEAEVARVIASAIRPGHPGVVIGAWEAVHPPCLDWLLATEVKVLSPDQGGFVAQRSEARKLLRAVRSRRLPDWIRQRIEPALTRAEQPRQTRTFYLLSPDKNYLESMVDNFEGTALEKVVLLTRTDERTVMPLGYFEGMLQKMPVESLTTVQFADPPVRIDVFRRR